MFVVTYGSLQDGYNFIGPFETDEEARIYAGSLMETCQVIELDEPQLRRRADRNADRIDGYDQDDLGESPDF